MFNNLVFNQSIFSKYIKVTIFNKALSFLQVNDLYTPIIVNDFNKLHM